MQHSINSSMNTDNDEWSEFIEIIENELFNELVDEIILGTCLDTHRAFKLGFLFLDESPFEEDSKYKIVVEKGLDIFGRACVQLKKQYETNCICPNCQRSIAAQRFAPHLEKCMGMGRNSSRIANRRIINSTGKSNGESDTEDCDNSADIDWNYNQDMNRKSKKKRERNGAGNNLHSIKRSNGKNNIFTIAQK